MRLLTNEKWRTRFFPLLLGGLTSVCLFWLTESCDYNTKLFQMEWKNIAMNVAIIFFVLLAVYVISDHWWVSILTSGILFSVLCVVNVYSIQFRNTPVSARDLFNARSAANVLGSYKIAMNGRVLSALLVCLGLCLLAYLCCRLEKARKHSWKYWGFQLAVGFAAIIGFFWFFCLGPHAVKPANISTLRYEEGYQVYGFMQVSVEIFQKAVYKIEKPEGYALEAITGQSSARYEKAGDSPEREQPVDILLIINESWYDVSLVSNLTTDVEVMPYIGSLKNAMRGYVVEPNISGGTNLSEYEALTGNSLQLMQGITPFNSLNMEGASSIVSCLKEQGYQTAAMHPETRSTYNRIIAYPAMGFDKYYFIDDFEDWEYWEQRTEYVTDESNFRNLLKIYEEDMTEEAPRFLYNLTTQNHGDYTLNNYRKSIVHVQEEYEDVWTEYRLNEYLSCVKLTDEAFGRLTQYFEEQEQPVLICMLGDRAPAFVENIADKVMDEKELDMKLRSTPYVIWANYELEETELPEFMGLPYIPAVLLKLAGARSTPYYSYMEEAMLPEVPVLTAYQQYRDKEGVFYHYGDVSPYAELLDTYFYMEYNTVHGGAKQVDSLFHLPQ